MSGDAVLVFVTRPLTIFRQCFQGLVDEGDVVLIDVEAEKTQFARCRSANAVKEHGCLGDQIVAVFIGLGPQKVLQVSIVIFIQQLQKRKTGNITRTLAYNLNPCLNR